MRLIDSESLKKSIAATESEKLNRMDHPPIIECMMTIKEAFDYIDKEPTADLTRHARWIARGYDYRCSDCGQSQSWVSHYCPSCGAAMVEEIECD